MTPDTLALAAVAMPGFLKDPLYASITAGFLLLGGVMCFTKFEQPIIGIVLCAAAGFLGYNVFSSVG